MGGHAAAASCSSYSLRVRRCALKPRQWMQPWCVPWLRSCGDERCGAWDRERRIERRTRLAGCGCDRHAEGVHRSERSGAACLGEQSVVRSTLRLSRSARRFAQTVVVGWNWAVLNGQTLRAWSIYLATSAEWTSIAECSATFDVARGNRLATSGSYRRAADRDVNTSTRNALRCALTRTRIAA